MKLLKEPASVLLCIIWIPTLIGGWVFSYYPPEEETQAAPEPEPCLTDTIYIETYQVDTVYLDTIYLPIWDAMHEPYPDDL